MEMDRQETVARTGMPAPERCAGGTYDILTKRVNGFCSTFSRLFFRFAKRPNSRQILPEKNPQVQGTAKFQRTITCQERANSERSLLIAANRAASFGFEI